MNDNFGNLKLLLDSDSSAHPRCKHGPTLLFSRQVGGMEGIVKKFYACSAYRNRKDCDFYQEAGSKITQAQLFRLSQASKLFLASNDLTESNAAVVRAREEVREDSEEKDDLKIEENGVKATDEKTVEFEGKENEPNGVMEDSEGNENEPNGAMEDLKGKENEPNGADAAAKEPAGVLKFCQDCGRVSTPACMIHNITNLSRQDLDRPARVLKAKSAERKEAQYFFSDSSRQFLIDTISSQGFTHVLCVGCPSVFECLPDNISSNSLLLDLDPRFLSFYTSQNFLWYNFFNGHFFHGEKSSIIFRDFLISCDKLLILLDPPFGAKTELISHSLERITSQLEMLSISATVSTIWVFPYFMERQLKQHRFNLVMSDYRVTYSGHVQFSAKDSTEAPATPGARKLGSPVRLFTDIALSALQLPASEGYRLCAECSVWVAAENRHCDQCGVCTSKDGRTYVHCDDCKRCVKPTYTHCKGCDRCKLPEHKCGERVGGRDVDKEDVKKVVVVGGGGGEDFW
eukprot:GFUD01002163.1.p1 GENE.GFUD01002163.1~~GFUD01002163.1.p1  ORF type:complete len:515 (+),score=148.04 GFUD01002163.1:179-1723(+)